MRIERLFGSVLLALTWGCGTGTLEIGEVTEGEPGTNPGAETTPDPDPEPEPEPEPEPYEWAGTYDGEAWVYLWGQDWDVCDQGAEVWLVIDDEGVLTGEGNCATWSETYPLSFSGVADETGEITGTLLTEIIVDYMGNREPYEFELKGEVDDSSLQVWWDESVDLGEWEMDVAGEVLAK